MRPEKATCQQSGLKTRSHLWHTKSSVVEAQSCKYFLLAIDICVMLNSSPLLNDEEELRPLRHTDMISRHTCDFRSAATSSFVRTFKGEKMDYDRYLLSCISEVIADDVLNAVVSYLVPIFGPGPSRKLAVACPTSKLDYVHDYFKQKGWSNLKKVSEEDLFTAFVANDDA
jgi:hypothetical protein